MTPHIPNPANYHDPIVSRYPNVAHGLDLSGFGYRVMIARCASNDFTAEGVARERAKALRFIRSYRLAKENGWKDYSVYGRSAFGTRQARCDALRQIAYYKIIRNYIRPAMELAA